MRKTGEVRADNGTEDKRGKGSARREKGSERRGEVYRTIEEEEREKRNK